MRAKFERNDEVRKAYKLTQENLKSLDVLLKEFSNKIIKLTENETDKPYYLKDYKGPTYDVSFKDKSSRRDLSVEELLNLPNVSTEEIIEIRADTNLSVFEYNISITFIAENFAYFSNFYSIVSNDEDLFNTYDRKIQLFLEQIQKPFYYSVIRTNTLVSFFLIIPFILSIIFLNLYSFGFGDFIDTLLGMNEIITISIGVAIYLLTDHIKDYLLPLGEIWIGKGKEKAQQLENIRKFLVTVVFLGLIKEAWSYIKTFL